MAWVGLAWAWAWACGRVVVQGRVGAWGEGWVDLVARFGFGLVWLGAWGWCRPMPLTREAAHQPECVTLRGRLQCRAAAPRHLCRWRRQRFPAPRARVEAVQVGQPALGAAAPEDVQAVADRCRSVERAGRGRRATASRVELLGLGVEFRVTVSGQGQGSVRAQIRAGLGLVGRERARMRWVCAAGLSREPRRPPAGSLWDPRVKAAGG